MRFVVRLFIIAAIAIVGVTPTTRTAAAESPCDPGFALVLAGKLNQAELLAKAPALEDCGLTAMIAAARARATELYEKAQNASGDEKATLIAQAAAIDADNDDIKKLAAELKNPDQPKICGTADDALARGEWTLAESLYLAASKTEAGKACGEAGVAAVAQARAEDAGQRVTNLVAVDAVPVLTIGAICVLAGLILGAVLRAQWSAGAAWILGLATLLLLAAWLVARPIPSPSVGILEALIWIFAAAFGFALACYVRRSRPIQISISGSDDTLGPLVADAYARIAGQDSKGVSYVAGTDIKTDLLAAAQSQLSNPVAKALADIWSKLTSFLGSDVRVVLIADSAETAAQADQPPPTMAALVRLNDGAKRSAARLEAKELISATSTDLENKRQMATLIAAWLLIQYTTPDSKRRLYGADSPLSLALTIAAGEKAAKQDMAGALDLYQRAMAAQDANLAAIYGALSAQLDLRAKSDERVRVIARLTGLEDEIHTNFAGLPLEWRVKYTIAAADTNDAVTAPGWNEEKVQVCIQRLNDVKALAAENSEPEDQRLAAAIQTGAGEIAGLLKLLNQDDYAVQAQEKLTSASAVGPDRSFLLANLGAIAAHRFSVAHPQPGRTPKQEKQLNDLLDQTARHLEWAGGDKQRRAHQASDPVISLVTNEPGIRRVLTSWGIALSPLHGIQSFGKLAEQIATDGDGLTAFLSQVESPEGRAQLRDQYHVEDTLLRYWAGAAEWVSDGQDADTINVYQAIGIARPIDLAAMSDESVLPRLKLLSKRDSSASLPSLEKRQAMRLLNPRPGF